MPSNFGPPTKLGVGFSPNHAAIGDFTGDGKPDLVISNGQAATISLLRGTGNGNFAQQATFAAGNKPQWAVAGDFNGDNKLDVAVGNYYANTVSVLLGNGTGGFAAPTTFAVEAAPKHLALGDFNGDGKLDIAAANLNINTVSILLGNGDGTFQPQMTLASGISPETITVGDFNGDNKQDLIVPNLTDNNVGLFLGNGNGTFQAMTNFTAGTSPNAVAAGDFNGDNKLDVAVANYTNPGTVTILLGNGNGTFSSIGPLTAGNKPNFVAASDLNGDGKVDLVVVNVAGNTVSTFQGNGDGTFAAQSTFAADLGPVSVTAADLNGDGAADLVVPNLLNDSVDVFLNQGGTTTTLTSGTNPALTGRSIALTAKAQPVFPGTGTPTGSITFVSGSMVLGTAPLTGGTATFNLSPQPAGSLPITAIYNGDGTFNPSTSPTLTQVVQVPAIFVTGADAGGGPDVKVYNADGSLRFGFFAFNAGFTGGVRVAAGDVNGDGFPDVILAAGPGGGPNIRVIDGRTGQPLGGPVGSFFPYDPNFTGGVFVAAGDVNGDGFADIVTAADAGGGPDVKVINGKDGTPIYSFFAYDPRFGGGIRVAAGDVDGDGKADVITGAGPGGGPDVKTYRGFDGQFLHSFFAYDARFAGGVYVSAGDVTGDGKAEIVVGAGPGGGPDVSIFDVGGLRLNNFFPYDPAFTGGVRVAVLDRNGDGRGDIISVAGPGGGADVRTTDGVTLRQIDEFFAYNPAFTGGLYVAAST